MSEEKKKIKELVNKLGGTFEVSDLKDPNEFFLSMTIDSRKLAAPKKRKTVWDD